MTRNRITRKKSSRKARSRRGATMTETAIVLIILLMLVFGMIDLGVMVARSQSLSQAARSGARAAIVRGEFADRLGHLGPTAISGNASASNAVADAVRPQLSVMNPLDVSLDVTWPDGNNEINSRVRVTLSAKFTPMITFLFGSPTWTLSSSSEMTIAH